MKKRLLSVAMILSMLASLLMVGVAGPASAVRETFTTAVSLIDYESLTPEVNLTFEGEETEKYGIPLGRWLLDYSYNTEEGTFGFLTSSSTAIFFGKDGSVGEAPVTHNAAGASDAVENLYTFEQGKTYTVKFDIKARSGYAVTQGYTFKYGLVADPTTTAITVKGGMEASSIIESNLPWEYKVSGSVVEDGTELETDTDWETVTITFKVSTEGKFGICYTDGGNKPIAIDNVKIYDITDQADKSVTMTTDYISYDMTGVTINSNATGTPNGDFVVNGTSTASVVKLDDAHGDVLQVGNRGTFADSNVFVKGKKFYISFDGRSTSGAAQAMSLWLANLKSSVNSKITYGSQANPRYEFKDSSPFEFYINGNEVGFADFKMVGTEWQHFGIIIDLTDTTVVSAIENTSSTGGATFFDTAKYFYFGVANSQYDNFKIISTHDVDNALSEVKDSNFTYEKVVYENDMSSATLYQNPANCASVSNGVVNVTSGRFAVAGSNVITANHKYTISFDAKLNDESVESARMYLILSSTTTSYAPRYMFDSANGSIPSTSLWVKDAFTLYIDGVETAYEDFALNNELRRYTIKFDFTNANFLELGSGTTGDMAGLTAANSYFYVGSKNASSFDNFQIVEEAVGTYVEPSTRKAMTTEEGDYLSAGLRFKASVPNSLIESSTEIGFVAAPSSSASLTEDWYKLDNGVNKVARKGVVYVKDGYNYAYSTEGSYTDYQLVITGLSAEEDGKLEGKTAYNRRYSVVVYAKDAEGNYTYSAVGEASYYQVLGMSTIFGE